MRALLIRFRKARSGLAAVEFALILPVMITLFFGTVELSLALGCRADVANAASTVADLVAQESAVTGTDIVNVFNAGAAILYPNKIAAAPPNGAALLTMTIYSIIDEKDSSGKPTSNPAGKVAWSCTRAGSGAPVDGPTTPPDHSTGGEMITKTNLVNGTPQYGGGGSVILVTVSYKYVSPTTNVITGDITMSNSFYAKPRRSNLISKPAGCSA